MKKMISAAVFAAFVLSAGVTVYAADTLDRDVIEDAIWEDFWNGKGDDGLEYPEASYTHHLLDQWLDANYGLEDYDWSEVGEPERAYMRYYRNLIMDWNFEDDNNGGWTISTADAQYSFMLADGNWQMLDQTGVVVDSFPPFSTLEEASTESFDGTESRDSSADSPRVIGEVTGTAESLSEPVSVTEGTDTGESLTSDSEGISAQSGMNPLPILAAVAAAAAAGGAVYYFIKKRR